MNKQFTAFHAFVLIIVFVIIFNQYGLLKRNFETAGRISYFDALIQESNIESAQEPRDGNNYPGDRGDWLVWALKVEPKSLNTLSAQRDVYQLWITTPNIFEPLLKYDFETIELKPFLAESYSVSEDGLVYTFVLRDDIFFSDSHPITADDVVFTMNTIMDPSVLAGSVASMFTDVADVEKVDCKTVRIRLNRPHFKALENLSLWNVGVLPEHIYAYDNPQDFIKHISNPIGSGPYVFESWAVGQQIILNRNENYWGKKPNLERIVFRFIKNDLAIVQAFKAGEVDLLRPPAEQFWELSRDSKFSSQYNLCKFWTPMSPFYYIGWNQAKPCFADRDTRLALTHLINRDMIVEHFQKNNASVVTGPFFFKGKQYDSEVAPLPWNPQKAAKLLRKAGWCDNNGDGILERAGEDFSFTFTYNTSDSFYARLAVYLKDSLKKAGIVVITEPTEWSVLIDRVVDKDFESVVLGWGGEVLEDPYQLWHSSQIENKGSNFVGFSSEIADKLIESARCEIDEEKRNEMFHQLHQLIHKEQPYTFLYAVPEFRVVNKRFENINVHPLGLDYFEWYVPKEKQKY